MSAVGQANPFSDASEYNTLAFIIARATDEMQTVTIAQVRAVDTTAKTVDALVLVNLVTGSNTPVPHDVIAGRPYFRLQGGGNAIICDPEVGDVGILVFASRDITGVVAARGAANPASNRRFSWSDGVYLGGVLNSAPTQYIRFAPGGITVVSPTAVALQTPTTTVTGTATVQGNTTLQATLAVTGTSTLTGAVSAPGGITTTTIAGASAVFSGSVTASSFIGGGGGSVTSVGISTPGVGLTVGGGPITTSGTLTVDLSVTAYAALALAVTALQTAQSQNSITGSGTSGSKLQLVNDSASPGASQVYGTDGSGVKGWQAAGGGGSLTVTDGTHSVTGVTSLTFSGATVSGSTPNATATITQGGGGTGAPGAISNLCYWFQADTLTTGGTFYPVLLNETAGFATYSAVIVGTAGITVVSTLNSKNVATFSGSAEYILPGAGPVLQPCTIFAVINLSSLSGNPSIWGGSSAGALEMYVNSSNQLGLVIQSVAIIAGSTTAITANTWYQVNMTYSGTAWFFRIARAAAGNGTGASRLATAGSGGIMCASNGSGGAGGPASGMMAECIVYNRVLSGAEITTVETYLNTKWGV